MLNWVNYFPKFNLDFPYQSQFYLSLAKLYYSNLRISILFISILLFIINNCLINVSFILHNFIVFLIVNSDILIRWFLFHFIYVMIDL